VQTRPIWLQCLEKLDLHNIKGLSSSPHDWPEMIAKSKIWCRLHVSGENRGKPSRPCSQLAGRSSPVFYELWKLLPSWLAPSPESWVRVAQRCWKESAGCLYRLSSLVSSPPCHSFPGVKTRAGRTWSQPRNEFAAARHVHVSREKRR